MKMKVFVLLLVLGFPVSIFAETIVLKTGKTVEGKIVEKTNEYIKVDFQGVPVTYFIDEIESVDETKSVDETEQSLPVITEEESSQENNLTLVQPETAEEYFKRGIDSNGKGDFAQGLSDLSKAIEIDPNFAGAYGSRAFVYYKAKEYDKAWEDVRKAEGLGTVVDPEFLSALKEKSGMDK